MMYQVHWRDSPRPMDCSPVFRTRGIAKRWVILRSIAERTAIEGYSIREISHNTSGDLEYPSWLPKGWRKGDYHVLANRYFAIPPDHPDHNEYGEVAP